MNKSGKGSHCENREIFDDILKKIWLRSSRPRRKMKISSLKRGQGDSRKYYQPEWFYEKKLG
jgi:hypothetical protein